MAVHVWNHAAEELFGWSAAEVVGDAPPFVTAETKPALDRLVARVFRGRTVKGHTHRYVRHDGEPVDVDVSIAPLRNVSGRVTAAVAVLADVTEQRLATQALRESEVWFRSLVQHSSDMVMVIAGDGTMQYLSPSVCEFAGLDAGRVIGRRTTDVLSMPADERAPLQEIFGRLRAHPGATVRMMFRMLRADGAWRWLEIAASNLLDDSAVQGIVVNARDVTEKFEIDSDGTRVGGEAPRVRLERYRRDLRARCRRFCAIQQSGRRSDVRAACHR